MKWKENHDNDYYIKCFKEQVLNQTSITDIMKDLFGILSFMTLEDNQTPVDIALVCYEKSSDFCHRHLVADWLNENGVQCCEWQ